jgi:hypothetical protein
MANSQNIVSALKGNQEFEELMKIMKFYIYIFPTGMDALAFKIHTTHKIPSFTRMIYDDIRNELYSMRTE